MAEADIAANALRANQINRTCFVCEQVFHRRNRGRRDSRKCCSRECGWQWGKAIKAAKRPVVFRIRKARCAACDKPFIQNGSAKFCSPVCNGTAQREAKCGRCGETFTVPRWSHGSYCPGCHQAARKDNKKEYAKRSGVKAAARKARKLRLRGVQVEAVNPLVVLDRDSWTCQLCGIKTPKRLRGTYEDKAPEVDHIIPIAEGGEHSYRNTQCACRRCNLAKSGRAKGQMRLFG